MRSATECTPIVTWGLTLTMTATPHAAATSSTLTVCCANVNSDSMSGLAISDRNSHYARSPRAFLVPHPERCHGILSASLRRPNDVVGPPEVQRRTALCEGSRSCLSEVRSGEKKAVSACVTIKQRDMSTEWVSGQTFTWSVPRLGETRS